MATQSKPFDFRDFRRSAAAAAPQAAPDEDARLQALAEARSEGVIEGRRLAMETIAADEAASLARIAASLERSNQFLGAARASDRREMLALASVFLEEFCAGLAEAREFEAAVDLLRRLTEHSDDQRPARLVLAEASRERLSAKIGPAIDARRLGGFVTIEGDRSLDPGEMRLEWRGGEAQRTRMEIAKATRAVIDALNADITAGGEHTP